MIDAIWVSTSVHFATGATVVVATLAAWLASLVQAVRNRPLPRWIHGLFIAAQLSLAVQVLLGIKLLDQGLGPLVAGLAFLFVMMAFGIGHSYDPAA